MNSQRDHHASETDRRKLAAIRRCPETAWAPLSFGQRQLWFLQQMLPHSPAYNVPFALRLETAVDVAVLERAINEIIKRQETLRTRFVLMDGEPVQVVEPLLQITIQRESLSHPGVENQPSLLQKRLEEEGKRTFNLEHLPLLRVYIFELSSAEQVLLVVVHHILSDGWSVDIFFRELEALYEAFIQGQESPLEELPYQYRDYARLQAESLHRGELEAGIEYWKKQVSDACKFLELPTDYLRPLIPRFEGTSHHFQINESITSGLKELSSKSEVTLYMTLLAAFAVLLHRYSGQEQILIGSPIANRSHEQWEAVIGFFANTLVMRVDLSRNVRFAQLLRQVKATALAGYARQDVPFEVVVERLTPERSLNRTPLFQAMFVMQSTILSGNAKWLRGSSIPVHLPVAKFDLSLGMRERSGKLCAEFNYDTALFSEKTILKFEDNFVELLHQLARNPSLRISDLRSLLTPTEEEEIRRWNSTAVNYSEAKHLHVLFENQVRLCPLRQALVTEDEELTYVELNHRANQVAHHLQKLGVGPETYVGVCMERSWEMVVSLLGILKTGGAYLPLDPEYPRERLNWMKDDARSPVVLVQERFAHLLDESEGSRTIFLDSSWNSISQEPDYDCVSTVSEENTAYVIYTSGSTGTPKGVMNRHRGICNRLLWMQNQYMLDQNDRILQKTPYSFDVSVWEFFWPLITGACLVMAKPGGHRDTSYLRRVIQRERITTIHFVPSMLKSMLQADGLTDCTSLRRVICSGEALGVAQVEQFYRQSQAELHNLYGPTEASVDVTYWACEREKQRNTIPIGRPIANLQIYLLDENFMQVPVLLPGELCIGGEGLSRGYVNRPDLTAEKFIPNPFAKNGERLYRTGDLARYANDGAIEYLGRTDYQVKIRGNRIELGEIEEALKQHASVQDSAVIAREDVDGKQLVAYIETQERSSIGAKELRAHLKSRLPEFMIPSSFVFLDKLPLSANGKLDRKALLQSKSSEPFRPAAEVRSFLAPRNLMEEKLALIWAKVLRVDGISPHDNFFDLGGHSLGLIKVQSELKQSLQIEISVIDLLRLPTIESLANHLTSTQRLPSQKDETENRANAIDTKIAIIGMAGRFPGAHNIEQFWENLKNGVESVSFFSKDEILDVPIVLQSDPNYVRAAAVLDDADLFDADFFGFRHREAEITDPQQRVFLECAWELFERAGYDPGRYPEPIGVFAGMGASAYWFHLQNNPEIMESVNSFQLNIGNDKDHLPLRVSYKLNLKGPSVSVQTACSTSLVAVHMACQSLLQGECKMAMAGGVSIRANQRSGYLYQEGGIGSPDGHCRAFDADAAGTIVGNGAAVVLLKRLEDAVNDGDHIHAVILGSAINNDGSLKVGYTAPSIDGQAEVIARAQAKAGVSADTICYIEAHGTATPLGDPIEVAALTQAFGLQTKKKQFCAIGSVKTNVGHLDAAAGTTGLIKTVLALEHHLLPPSLHFKSPNPGINLALTPFYVNSELKEWKCDSGPRRAGVSSFGIGGTNAHVVLEEAPGLKHEGPSSKPQLLVLSCRSEAALRAATLQLAKYSKEHPEASMQDVAFTLQAGRREFPVRRAILCENRNAAIQTMESENSQKIVTANANTPPPPVYFLFPGQGAQYVNMARGVYESAPLFRREIDRCSEILRSYVGRDFTALIHPEGQDMSRCEEELCQTANAQPALFMIEYAFATLWMELGVTPEAMLGHSLGEYVAACLAGVMSLEDALRLVIARGQLMQNMPPGVMLSVAAPEKALQELLQEHNEVVLAAVNAPSLCVVSGPPEEMLRFETQLADHGLEGHRLRTSHAFHSPMMTPVAGPLRDLLAGMKLRAPSIPFLSNLTGRWITAEQATNPDYWVNHLLHTVRFSDNLQHLLKQGRATLLEMGPDTLIVLAKRHPENNAENTFVASIKSRSKKEAEYLSFLHAVGTVWAHGSHILWDVLPREGKCKRVTLPTYPFERQRFNIPRAAGATAHYAIVNETDAIGQSQAVQPHYSTEKAPASTDSSGSLHHVVLGQLEVVARQLELLRQRIQ